MKRLTSWTRQKAGIYAESEDMSVQGVKYIEKRFHREGSHAVWNIEEKEIVGSNDN